jgi:hypothetical protein
MGSASDFFPATIGGKNTQPPTPTAKLRRKYWYPEDNPFLFIVPDHITSSAVGREEI